MSKRGTQSQVGKRGFRFREDDGLQSEDRAPRRAVVPRGSDLRPSTPLLEEAFDLAAPGEVHVVGGQQGQGYRATAQKPGGWVNTNMRTTFEKLIRRAGLKQCPRLFHNLRASCETDLMRDHPIHIVTAWIGNTPKIALGHYLQTLDGDFEKAIRGDADSDARGAQKSCAD